MLSPMCFPFVPWPQPTCWGEWGRTTSPPPKPEDGALEPVTGSKEREARVGGGLGAWGSVLGLKGFIQFPLPGPKITEPETKLCIHESQSPNLRLWNLSHRLTPSPIFLKTKTKIWHAFSWILLPNCEANTHLVTKREMCWASSTPWTSPLPLPLAQHETCDLPAIFSQGPLCPTWQLHMWLLSAWNVAGLNWEALASVKSHQISKTEHNNKECKLSHEYFYIKCCLLKVIQILHAETMFWIHYTT